MLDVGGILLTHNEAEGKGIRQKVLIMPEVLDACASTRVGTTLSRLTVAIP